jgi:hypothetical protein
VKCFGVYYLLPAVTFQITAAYELRPSLLSVRVLVAFRGQFSGITVLCQAAEDKPKGNTAESGPGYLGSMSVWGAEHRVKLSESRPKFNFTDFHIMLLHIT